jgi:hypothetical protein
MLIYLGIIIIHFIADFIFQSDWQAKNKSKNNKALTMHVLTYSTVWLLVANAYSIITGNYMMVAFLPIITFVAHWATDYCTSRINSYLWAKGDVHNFFVSVGFDQVLHYAQLFFTYYYLSKI